MSLIKDLVEHIFTKNPNFTPLHPRKIYEENLTFENLINLKERGFFFQSLEINFKIYSKLLDKLILGLLFFFFTRGIFH